MGFINGRKKIDQIKSLTIDMETFEPSLNLKCKSAL